MTTETLYFADVLVSRTTNDVDDPFMVHEYMVFKGKTIALLMGQVKELLASLSVFEHATVETCFMKDTDNDGLADQIILNSVFMLSKGKITSEEYF